MVPVRSAGSVGLCIRLRCDVCLRSRRLRDTADGSCSRRSRPRRLPPTAPPPKPTGLAQADGPVADEHLEVGRAPGDSRVVPSALERLHMPYEYFQGTPGAAAERLRRQVDALSDCRGPHVFDAGDVRSVLEHLEAKDGPTTKCPRRAGQLPARTTRPREGIGSRAGGRRGQASSRYSETWMFNQLPRCVIDSARADRRLPASISRAGISLRSRGT